MTYQWTTPIRYVRGLGPVKAKELTKIGITTVGELLERHPLSYIYPGGVSIADAKEGNVVIKAKIKNIMRVPFRAGLVEAFLTDGTGICKAVWYNNPYTLSSLRPGMTVTFWGKYKGGVLQQPKWSTCEASMIDVWGGQYGVHHATIRAALKEVLGGKSCAELNTKLPSMNDGSSRLDCFDEFHFPYDKNMQQIARYNLKRDEALTLQLALAERRRGREVVTVEPMNCSQQLDEKIMSYFPYRFTADQDCAANYILECMTHMNTGPIGPMSCLIHGEVGSGKTAVAFYAAMLAALNSKRTLILCPTTILAQQHFDTLRDMGWKNVGLWGTGDMVGVGSNAGILPDIIIGTHALLNQNYLLESASLVIIDEFQKFGVEQRAKIQKYNPHLLLLSATPIPRTLASTVFGDLDVSVIRELPIKRGTVVTRWVLPDKREAMYEIIERELAKGHQAYVVYPRISGNEDVVSAERGFQELQERFVAGVDLLTGKDDTNHKGNVLRRFREGSTDILVSTIIAEVGLDNPNATVMVVEGADRFGLCQLHQLRGRVCRSTDTAFCFLVSETSNPTSIDRLTVIEQCVDGFDIAEHDLRFRGPGEVFSTRQSGLPDLKWISLVDDYDLMIEAKELVASGFVESGVREMMKIRYGENLQLGEVT